jgi:hypothetical protein
MQRDGNYVGLVQPSQSYDVAKDVTAASARDVYYGATADATRTRLL